MTNKHENPIIGNYEILDSTDDTYLVRYIPSGKTQLVPQEYIHGLEVALNINPEERLLKIQTQPLKFKPPSSVRIRNENPDESFESDSVKKKTNKFKHLRRTTR